MSGRVEGCWSMSRSDAWRVDGGVEGSTSGSTAGSTGACGDERGGGGMSGWGASARASRANSSWEKGWGLHQLGQRAQHGQVGGGAYEGRGGREEEKGSLVRQAIPGGGGVGGLVLVMLAVQAGVGWDVDASSALGRIWSFKQGMGGEWHPTIRGTSAPPQGILGSWRARGGRGWCACACGRLC
eukprot:scaffold1569_cov79-Isochrysis_galbana.AAC.1